MNALQRYSTRLVRDEAPPPFGDQIARPADVADLARAILEDEAQEVVLVFFLDRKHRVRGYQEIGRGGIGQAPAEPREIYQAALLANAAAVVVAHNHPSGDPEPSVDDFALARRLAQAGTVLGVDFVDHVVIGAAGAFVSVQARAV